MVAVFPIDLPSLESTAATMASAGQIDPLENLKGAPVWIFHGTSDTTVAATVNDALYQQYQDWGANAAYNNATDANHAWISPTGPNSCTALQSPYISNCPGEDNDPQNEFLTHLLGHAPNAAASSPSGAVTSVSQDDVAETLYNTTASSFSMDSTGYVYTPTACASNPAGCDLFIILHGCQQGYATVGPALIQDSNLLGYADSNNLVLLFPQAVADGLMGNSEGCWDWWGYTTSSSSSYVTKEGPQMAIINAMAKKVSATTEHVKPNPAIALE